MSRHEKLDSALSVLVVFGPVGLTVFMAWWIPLPLLGLFVLCLWHRRRYVDAHNEMSTEAFAAWSRAWEEACRGSETAHDDVWLCQQRPALDEDCIPDDTRVAEPEWQRKVEAFISDVRRHQHEHRVGDHH